MIVALKVILTVIIMLLLCYPFIPMKGALRKVSVASSLPYRQPHNRKNIFFFLVAIALFVVFAVLARLLDTLVKWIYSLPVVGEFLSRSISGIDSQVDYIFLVVKVLLINLVFIYLFIMLKAFLKRCVISPIFGLGGKRFQRKVRKQKKKKHKRKNKKNKKNKEDPAEDEPKLPDLPNGEEDEENHEPSKHRRIPSFVHSVLTGDEEDPEGKGGAKSKDGDSEADSEEDRESKLFGPVASWILSRFFEGEGFCYARPWVVRARTILQWFIRLVEVLYALFFLTMLLSAFFPLPKVLYTFLIDILRIGDWFMYPVISVVILQELCNVFNTDTPDAPTPEEQRKADEEEEEKKREAQLNSLLAELKKRFDAEHALRYYPEAPVDEVPEYDVTNVMYASALSFIRDHMQRTTGKVVQSYMEFLDAVYRETNAYFAASFYSELGEYLIAYTYIRLLAGSRMIFVVADSSERETLRQYISDRLMQLTGTNAGNSWRIYTADERLDQADVFIAAPEDFVNTDIVEQYPYFFEEACNAVFIDADRSIALNSYICPIIATKLQNATDGRIRFIFLTLDLLKGFAAGSLPRFFCVDKVLSFSSATENEAVSYVLWNKESKKHRIYNKSGQKLTSLETIIAEQACRFGVDGVRLITGAPLEHADRKILSVHKVEINNFYKNRVDVNYMIYSDERANLSAALYACTRFRGRKKSVVHIISKPYLLREYFMSKAVIEEHTNRSSFIQPRVTEHVERHKLSLLRIFCNATYENSLTVAEFEQRTKDVMVATVERHDYVSSAFCRHILATCDIRKLKYAELAAYVVAGLCDRDDCTTPEEELAARLRSVGNRAKDYYITVEPAGYSGYALGKEKYIIFNRVKEVFERLLECNRRVELRLNDKTIGRLDTFPDRAHLEYIAGQSIIYDNSEYEIEHVSSDGTAIYLRRENIGIKNCLDTVLLRKYRLHSLTPQEDSAVLNSSRSTLKEIRVTRCLGQVTAATYGFYSLTTDRQTLDFYHGVEGNPHSEHPNIREYSEAGVLHITLQTGVECNDGMRLLMSAVFNEFIRTLFPGAYRCAAICPVLAEPLSLAAVENNDTPVERIKTLYPFVDEPGEAFVETDPTRMQFLFINDCREDIGVLDWFYDRSGRYMQEFLANVYSYLYWLKLRPEREHYIYFGGKALPECYDLEGCCKVLGDLNLVLSEGGARDIETAGDDLGDEKLEYCSFCHKPVESGRFSLFDDHRFICASCNDLITADKQLKELVRQVREYLAEQYPEVSFGAVNFKLDSVYDLKPEQILSEFYSHVDFGDRTVLVEQDEPRNNVFVSVLRGLISFWQSDNSLANHYSAGQLYFEEIKYLRSIGEDVAADWVYAHVSPDVRNAIDEIMAFVNGPAAPAVPEAPEEPQSEEPAPEEPKPEGEEEAPEEEGEPEEKPEPTPTPAPVPEMPGSHTSFAFMRKIANELRAEEPVEEPTDEEYSDSLYDPNKIPRFWKRYLRGEKADGEEDEIPDSKPEGEDEDEEPTGDEPAPEAPEVPEAPETPSEEGDVEPEGENAPPPEDDGETVVDGDEETGEEPDAPEMPAAEGEMSEKDRKKAEKERLKAEKRRQKEEKRRQKQEEWERKIAAAKAEAEEKKTFGGKKPAKDPAEGEEEKPKKEKKPFSLFGRKKKQEPEEEPEKKTTDPAELPDPSETPDVPEAPTEPVDEPSEGEGKGSKPKKEKKPFSLFGRKNKKDPEGEPEPGDTPEEEPGEEPDKPAEEPAKKPEKKPKKPSGLKNIFGNKKNVSAGERILPHEEEEKTNPKIRLYNDMVRAAYNYSEEAINRADLTNDEVEQVFYYVKYDYPELFWLHGYSYSPRDFFHSFRCKDANGRLDIKQIERKRRELRKGAQFFTNGITKRTDPYQALLTIYRRVILTLDYDSAGLNAHIDDDTSRDDALRSLHNALVNHKVVCAGYAAAMQYLLQSVGIVCGYTGSEANAEGSHAFNILKIGKYCYYLDATWGDHSNTISSQSGAKDQISYDYFCVPYEEFLRTTPGSEPNHTPRKKLFPNLEEFHNLNHEYYRYHKAYVHSYNELELARIFAEAAERYDVKKDMGAFSISFRCATPKLAAYILSMLQDQHKLNDVRAMAIERLGKNKKAIKLLEDWGTYTFFTGKYTGVIAYYPEILNDKKGKK